MGRKPLGQTAKVNQVNVRLDDAEVTELDEKRSRRGGLDRGTYFRTLMKEDQR
ncbi:ribbon-helix-helix DNA binding domain protein [Microbacterium phage Phinky]|nr:ribbon-helix-helix DNA binding domain protein [Microbacterium phage Phinky]